MEKGWESRNRGGGGGVDGGWSRQVEVMVEWKKERKCLVSDKRDEEWRVGSDSGMCRWCKWRDIQGDDNDGDVDGSSGGIWIKESRYNAKDE